MGSLRIGWGSTLYTRIKTNNMKKIILFFAMLLMAVAGWAQQYYKVVRFDETANKLSVRINSTITPCFVEKTFVDKDKPESSKRKDVLKSLIKELRSKDSTYLSDGKIKKVHPKYFDN